MGQTLLRIRAGGDMQRNLEPGLWLARTGSAKPAAVLAELVAVSVEEGQPAEDPSAQQA